MLEKFELFAIVGKSFYEMNGQDKTVDIISWTWSETDAKNQTQKHPDTGCAYIKYEVTAYNVAQMLNKGLENARSE